MGNILRFAKEMELRDYCPVNPLVPIALGNDYYTVETKEREIKAVVLVRNNAVLETIEKIERIQNKGKMPDCWIVFEYLLSDKLVEEIRERSSVWRDHRILPVFWVEENNRFYTSLIEKEEKDAEKMWDKVKHFCSN